VGAGRVFFPGHRDGQALCRAAPRRATPRRAGRATASFGAGTLTNAANACHHGNGPEGCDDC